MVKNAVTKIATSERLGVLTSWVPRRKISVFLYPRSRTVMQQELCAYLVRDDGQVSQLPTDDLLVAFAQLRKASSTEQQNTSPGTSTIYEFLQTLKHTLRASREMRD